MKISGTANSSPGNMDSKRMTELLVTCGHGEQESKPASSAKARLSRLLFTHALSVTDAVKASAVVPHSDAAGNSHAGAAAKYDVRRRKPDPTLSPCR